jgi:C4-dicarboxylate-specific signal transduction histidine kinase
MSVRQKAEQEARVHRERLAHVDRVSLLGEMAAGIAHEINQPLTAIANYADAARRRVQSARADPTSLLVSLEKVSEQAQRAGEVIRRLRALVKRGETHRELVDINELVRDSVKLATVDARIHNIEIDLELKAQRAIVYVDSIQIQQVVLNLVKNAADATEEAESEHHTVLVKTEVVDEELVELSVTDHGVGITDDAAGQLFSPFFTTKKSGMGMGLSISHSIINSHGGHLWFSRLPEKGTIFHFTLPLEIDVHDG